MKQLQRFFAVFLLGLWSAARWRQCYAGIDPRRKTTDAASEPLFVNLTLITPVPGAVCLDGSLPGYHLHPGSGSGASSWLVYLEGGGWCNNLSQCVFRKTTGHGSSKFMEKSLQFSGILSNKPDENPDFYNWNRVFVRYCDGASFAGDGFNEERGLYFRGQRVWSAVMQELMSKGMSSAKQALLAGCSAGGLASILHCDEFQALFPVNTQVKCLADAGFFLDHADVAGGHFLRSFYEGVVTLHGVAQNLPPSCISQMNATSCFFPQNIVTNIQTPLFILNSAYDTWQIRESLAPDSADPNGYWKECKMSLLNCNSTQLDFLQEFRGSMLAALEGFSESDKNGLFINSCFSHCQSDLQETWHGDDSPAIENKGIATSVGDWYLERSKVKAIDCQYPCDKSCHRLVRSREVNDAYMSPMPLPPMLSYASIVTGATSLYVIMLFVCLIDEQMYML